VASLNFSEILQYPANKLHRTVTLHGTRGSLKDAPLGSLDLWFKLHATDLRPVHRYAASRRQEETLLATAASDLAALKVDMAADGGLHILQDKSRNRRVRPLSAGSQLHKSRQAAVSPSLRGDAKGGRGLLERKRGVLKAQKERPEEEEPEGRKEEVVRKNEVPEVKEEKEDKKTLSKGKDPLRKVSRERSKIPQSVQPRDGTASDVSLRVEQQLLEQHVVASPEVFSQSFNTLIAKSVQPLDNVARTRPKPPRVSKRSVGEKQKIAEASVLLPQQRTLEDAMATEPTKTKEIKSILVKKSGTSVRQDKPSGRRRVSLEEEEELTTTTITTASVQQQQQEGRAAVATTASTSSRSLEIEETEDEEEEESDDEDDDGDDDSSNDEEEEEGSEEDDDDEDDDDEETTTMQSSATTTAATTTETTTHLDTEDTSSAAAVGGRTAMNRRVVLANVERSGGETPADSDGVVVSQEQKSLSRKGFLFL
jgi:hypothetical protein